MKLFGRSNPCPCGSKKKFSNCCLNDKLMAAHQLMEAGDLTHADAICGEVLDREADHGDALHLAGMVKQRLGDYERAALLMKRSIKILPTHGPFHCNLGDVFRAMGRVEDAVSSYRQAVRFDRGNVQAHNNLAVNLRDAGKLDESEAVLRTAVALDPRNPLTHFNLGETLTRMDRAEKGTASYATAISLDPNMANTLYSLGTSYFQGRMLEEALCCFRQLIRIKPDHAQAYLGLGATLSDLGNHEEVIDCYRRAIALDATLPWAHNNLGNALLRRGELDEAIVSFGKALAARPDFAEAAYNMGNAMLGNALKGACRLDEAIAAYRQALGIKPDFHAAYCNMLMAYQYSTATNEEIFDLSAEFGRRIEGGKRPPRPLPDRTETERNRLRVGVVSADLKEHVVAQFLEAPLRHLDRNGISVIAYANQDQFDETSARIRPLFADWIEVKGMTDGQVAERIRADRIDVLVDLSGHTADNRLGVFALAPAPVQITWLGYPHTTGMRAMDYIIADRVTIPENEERFYTEKVWRLPETYICFTPPSTDAVVAPLPCLDKSHVTFGCLNNPAKLNDEVVACWAAILARVPQSCILFKYWRHYENRVTQERFIERFAAHGTDPSRLLFEGATGRDDHLSAYHRIDIALDPFPYNGVTTSCEAAWMGVPTLTLRMARGIIAHNGELIMKNLGLPGWVAGSVEEYVEKAQGFADDVAALAGIRSTLRNLLLASPLCDGERFALHLAEALTAMLREKGSPRAA